MTFNLIYNKISGITVFDLNKKAEAWKLKYSYFSTCLPIM